jgi:hypothetical protein
MPKTSDREFQNPSKRDKRQQPTLFSAVSTVPGTFLTPAALGRIAILQYPCCMLNGRRLSQFRGATQKRGILPVS